jgi:hypothetical protein
MTFDESFDERTERQHCETSCAGVFQSKPDQPISESATLEALVYLGVDELDQAGARAIDGEANHLAVNRQLVTVTVRRVSHLDTLRHSHAGNIRTQTTGTARTRRQRLFGGHRASSPPLRDLHFWRWVPERC